MLRYEAYSTRPASVNQPLLQKDGEFARKTRQKQENPDAATAEETENLQEKRNCAQQNRPTEYPSGGILQQTHTESGDERHCFRYCSGVRPSYSLKSEMK